MRNIARWSPYSYRTVQRFFNTPIGLEDFMNVTLQYNGFSTRLLGWKIL
jgi:hypothetical protein